MNKQLSYSADHPVVIALSGIALAIRTGRDVLAALADQAEAAGVRPFSDHFDDAARLAGYYYSRAWDAYVSREDFNWAESQPFAHMH
ncbi:TPA: hypothetical protein N2B39_002396 [Pseudomonas aeruginosa]|nr:hypothetical protein [Pseudomonas aeruginosa]MDV6687946.1 hypothetical protein [Pseudomonas aeruginosa]HCL3865650.1 hypothetical protein [Pseudomonas aeruginosa]